MMDAEDHVGHVVKDVQALVVMAYVQIHVITLVLLLIFVGISVLR